jgi:hypothetical protein
MLEGEHKGVEKDEGEERKGTGCRKGEREER